MVKRFDHEGLHQLLNCLVADEDLRGRNVYHQSLHHLFLQELNPAPRQVGCRSITLYHTAIIPPMGAITEHNRH